MELTDIAKSLLGEIRKLAETETVVGKPIQVGQTLILPVTKLSVGFGTGQSGAARGDGASGGLGAGVAVQPLGFLVVDGEGRAQLLSVADGKQGALVKAIETVPELVDRLAARSKQEGRSALGKGSEKGGEGS